MIVKEYLWPKRILMQTGDITYGENLKIEVPRQILIGTPSKEYTRINGRASILLDFGIEARAALRILCRTVERADGIGTTRVRIRLGESASECCAELGERGACNDHSPRDFEIVLTGMSDNCWGQSGFRFARLDFLDDDVVVNIHAILAEGETNAYLADVDEQAHEMLISLIVEFAKAQGIDEHLKATDQMRWVHMMNNVHSSAEETVMRELILA